MSSSETREMTRRLKRSLHSKHCSHLCSDQPGHAMPCSCTFVVCFACNDQGAAGTHIDTCVRGSTSVAMQAQMARQSTNAHSFLKPQGTFAMLDPATVTIWVMQRSVTTHTATATCSFDHRVHVLLASSAHWRCVEICVQCCKLTALQDES
jgi:hypothetical protein